MNTLKDFGLPALVILAVVVLALADKVSGDAALGVLIGGAALAPSPLAKK